MPILSELGHLVITGHFGHKTLRHQDTLGHFGTDLKTLRHQKRVRDTSTRVPWSRKSRDTSTQDTALPVIRLKLRHQFCSAEVSRCRSVRLPSGGYVVVYSVISVWYSPLIYTELEDCINIILTQKLLPFHWTNMVLKAAFAGVLCSLSLLRRVVQKLPSVHLRL